MPYVIRYLVPHQKALIFTLFFFFCRFVDILRENGGDIKECPLCQVLIMREAGCAQMMCGHCKHIFCWHCRKSLDVSN